MDLIRAADVTQLSNSGVTSRQLLFPENSRSTRITITCITVKPGAKNPPHRHATSEQVWVALRGNGQLLFEYLSVTPPPANFRAAYEQDWSAPSTQ